MRSQIILRRIISLITAVALAACMPMGTAAGNAADDVFYDDFNGSELDMDKWLIAEKNWGGAVNIDGVRQDYNGGVISDNVAVRDGDLVLTGLGNDYTGELRGINRDMSRRGDGKRCGGAIATKDYFASGSYEIRAKIAPKLGCCSAMWTFEYEEDYSNDTLTIVNHEIDIEFPGRDNNNNFSLSHALCTTWITEEDNKTSSVNCGEQADGEYHTYRFDWHTGDDGETPRVEYYFDDVLTYTSYEYIPTNESRLWLGLWFPKNWAGTPDFEQTEFEVDYVKITPFHESGDTRQHESYPDHGWADAELPKGWLLWHSYSKYADLDSELHLRTPDGTIKTVSGDFIHAMNGSFGRSPEQFTFMAIDKAADEWDIYLSENGNVTNLTKNSGFRNEDPKFSPDGRSIVFKRGHWDETVYDFVYDLALMDVKTREVTMLTNDGAEEAMPCFSEDGKSIYYASYTGGIGSICRLDMTSHKTETIFSESGVTAYYPVVCGDILYFTKWYSADNRCDRIMCYDGGKITSMPFDSEKYDCSDACPVSGIKMVFSSTMNGGYDLYYFDGTRTSPLSKLNTDKNELGADFFPFDSVRGDVDADGKLSVADLVLFQKWLLGAPDAELKNWRNADLCKDDKLDVFDLCMMRRELLST